MAAIGSLDEAVAILSGHAGTIVTPSGHFDDTPGPASSSRVPAAAL
jgi:hypothetical protein